MFSTVAVCVIAAFMASECYGALTTVPVPQTAFVGQRVVFNCATNNTNCTIQWMFVTRAGTQAMIYNGQDVGYGYSVDHSTPESYNLIIIHTSSSHAGSFVCQETCSFVIQQSAPAPLIVLDVASTTNATSQLATSDIVLVSCQVVLYNPAYPTYSNVSVTIYDRAQNVVADQSYQFFAIIYSNLMMSNYNQTLSTNVAVTEPTFGPFYCEVRCLDLKPVVSQTITLLQLQYTFYPVGAVDVKPSSGELSAGDVVNCSASGYREPTYFWERNLNNTWQRIHNGSVLTLTTPGTYILRCTAFNTVRNISYSNTSSVVEFHISETTGHATIGLSGKPDNNSSKNAGVGSTDSSTSGVGVGVGVGAGVGVGLPLLVLVVVLGILCLRHKPEKAKPTETTLYEAPGFVNPAMPEAVYTALDHIHPAGQSDVLRTGKEDVQRDSDYLESRINYQSLTVGHRQTNDDYATLNVQN